MESSAMDSGSFVPTFQFGNLEIHKVCLRFPNFNLCQNLALTIFVDFIIASLENEFGGFSMEAIVSQVFGRATRKGIQRKLSAALHQPAALWKKGGLRLLGFVIVFTWCLVYYFLSILSTKTFNLKRRALHPNFARTLGGNRFFPNPPGIVT